MSLFAPIAPPDEPELELDLGAVAAALSVSLSPSSNSVPWASNAPLIAQAEFDTLDASLILALLSDYHPSTLRDHLDEIRDQLGILQACAVIDAADAEEAWATGNGDALDGGAGSLPLSASGSAQGLEELEGALRDTWISADADASAGATSVASRSAASSVGRGSGSQSSKSTTPTSVYEEWPEPEWEDEVDVLRSLFPNQPEAELQKAFAESISLQSAIDELLSIEAIRHAEAHGLWAEDEAPPVDSWETVSKRAKAKAKGKAVTLPKKSKKLTTRTIPLVDTLQRRSTPSTPPSPLTGPSPSAWHTLTSLAAHLAELLPPNTTMFFLSYLHSAEYRSAHAAIRAALVDCPSKEVASGGPTEQILQDLFGLALLPGELGLKKQADLRLAMRAGGEDIGVVMDLVDVLNEVALWPADDDEETYDELLAKEQPKHTVKGIPAPLPHATPIVDLPARLATLRNKKGASAAGERSTPVPGAQTPSSAPPLARDDFGSPSSARTPDVMPKRDTLGHGHGHKQIHPQNWRKVSHTRPTRHAQLHPYAAHIPSYARGATPHDPSPGALYRSPDDSVDACLARAAADRARREEAIRAVGRHFAGHLPGGKGINASVAGHYAAQARAAQSSAREWEVKAARMVVGAQLDRTGHTVDLHHLTVDEARTVAVEAAEQWWLKKGAQMGRSVQVLPSTPLTVITGQGRHSVGNKGVLGPAVAAELERAGWRVERCSGYLCVKGKK